jgi:hypothetical protein
MNPDLGGAIILVALTVVGILFGAGIPCLYYYKKYTKMAELGYEEKALEGTMNKIWVKRPY